MECIKFSLPLSCALAFMFFTTACSRHSHSTLDHPHTHGVVEADAMTNQQPSSRRNHTPNEAFEKLVDGNARFVAGKPEHRHEARSWRAALEAAQHPFATVIGCSDSRVPIELLFDQGFGDLFVIRVAGNLVARDETGSVEYAVNHLRTPIVAVIGHESCGAVTAALGSHEQITSEPPELRDLLASIHIGIPEHIHSLPPDESVVMGVEANVRNAMRQLLMAPSMWRAVSAGNTRVVGGIYDLSTGAVRWLNPLENDSPNTESSEPSQSLDTINLN